MPYIAPNNTGTTTNSSTHQPKNIGPSHPTKVYHDTRSLNGLPLTAAQKLRNTAREVNDHFFK